MPGCQRAPGHTPTHTTSTTTTTTPPPGAILWSAGGTASGGARSAPRASRRPRTPLLAVPSLLAVPRRRDKSIPSLAVSVYPLGACRPLTAYPALRRAPGVWQEPEATAVLVRVSVLAFLAETLRGRQSRVAENAFTWMGKDNRVPRVKCVARTLALSPPA